MQSPDLFPTMLSWSCKAFRQIILMRELTTSHPVTLCFQCLTLIWHWYCMTLQSKQTGIQEFLGTWEAGWTSPSTWPNTTPTAFCVRSFLLYASFCCRFLSTWATGNRIRETPWLVYLLRKFDPIRSLWPLMWISTKLTRSSWNDHVFGIFRCSKQSIVELQNPQSLKVIGKGTQISRKPAMKLTVVVGFGMFPDRLNRSWSSEHEFVQKRQGHQGFRAPQSKYWTI